MVENLVACANAFVGLYGRRYGLPCYVQNRAVVQHPQDQNIDRQPVSGLSRALVKQYVTMSEKTGGALSSRSIMSPTPSNSRG